VRTHLANANPQTSKNIETILKFEKENEGQLSPFHRLSHTVGRFVGTVYFVAVQCVAVAVWVGLNLRFFHHPLFDPFPPSVVGTKRRKKLVGERRPSPPIILDHVVWQA
jgi:uncharacterized membrane protein